MPSAHEPVLLHEVVKSLGSRSQRPNQQPSWFLDCTIGGAGHALAIIKAFEGRLNVIGLDRDEEAIKRARKTLRGKAQKLILECENFRNLDKILDRHGVKGADFILFDLGVSSDELDNSGKGFTFQKDEPLIMTMGDPENYPFTAKDIVNDWDEKIITDVLFGYSQERFAGRIARAIANYRTKKKIETSGELAEIVKNAIPPLARRAAANRLPTARHPATKTFQALRIAVNDELNALREGLNKGYERLNIGGRMAAISFHSLEDRIVKNFYKAKIEALIITKKPIITSPQEVAENPRSRSAKLRVLEKNDQSNRTNA